MAQPGAADIVQGGGLVVIDLGDSATVVPIVLAGFDYPRKVIFFGPLVQPTGDYEKDLAEIQSHFRASMALKPENYGL